MALRTTFLAVALLAALALGSAGAARAEGDWRPVTIEKSKGGVDATLTFERMRNSGVTMTRRLTLVVRRGGRVVLPVSPVCWGGPCSRSLYSGSVRLDLRNVWGGAEPEAVVSAFTGGAHCCSVLAVGVVGTDGRGRVLRRDFSHYGWKGQWHGSRYDLVGADARFAYTFTSFAGSWPAPQVVAIDRTGRRFIDVTRSRPDIVAANASHAWDSYVESRGQADSDSRGAFAGWCADEYLLGQGGRCETELASGLRSGYFDAFSEIERDWPYGPGFAAALHRSLRAWGYRT